MLPDLGMKCFFSYEASWHHIEGAVPTSQTWVGGVQQNLTGYLHRPPMSVASRAYSPTVRGEHRNKLEQQSFLALTWWWGSSCSLSVGEKLAGKCSWHDRFNAYCFLCFSTDFVNFSKRHMDACECARVCVSGGSFNYPHSFSFPELSQLSLWLC
jgi:hypothetical protein